MIIYPLVHHSFSNTNRSTSSFVSPTLSATAINAVTSAEVPSSTATPFSTQAPSNTNTPVPSTTLVPSNTLLSSTSSVPSTPRPSSTPQLPTLGLIRASISPRFITFEWSATFNSVNSSSYNFVISTNVSSSTSTGDTVSLRIVSGSTRSLVLGPHTHKSVVLISIALCESADSFVLATKCIQDDARRKSITIIHPGSKQTTN